MEFGSVLSRTFSARTLFSLAMRFFLERQVLMSAFLTIEGSFRTISNFFKVDNIRHHTSKRLCRHLMQEIFKQGEVWKNEKMHFRWGQVK